jgi:hypothetical protein
MPDAARGSPRLKREGKSQRRPVENVTATRKVVTKA